MSRRHPVATLRRMFVVIAATALVLPGVSVKAQETRGAPGAPFAESEVIVRFDPTSPSSSRNEVRQRHGLEKIKDLPLAGMELVRSRTPQNIPNLAHAVASEKSVLYAEPNFVASVTQIPNDPHFSLLWGLHNTGQVIGSQAGTADADIDGPEAWAVNGGAAPVIAVVDTGVDFNHPDLAANIWRNPGETANGADSDGNGFIDDIYGWDFYNDDNSVFDSGEDAHGTHVAGTIAAVRNNGIGVAGIAQAKIMVIKFLGTDGSGYISGAIQAIDYALENGAVLSNHSWGTPGYSQALADMVVKANSQNHLMIAAAGNQGVSLESQPTYPASFSAPNIVAVAATDNREALASFSNYGQTSVDIGAPGVSIVSTLPGGYGYMSGTSMAAPHVAGAAAQVLSVVPSTDYLVLKAALLDNGDAVSSLQGKTVTGRRLNLAGTIEALLSSPANAVATSAFRPLAPARILDTRPNSLIGYSGTKPGPGSTIDLQVSGRGGVPATGASAVVFNLAATEASRSGYITAWPAGQSRPLASSLNLEYPGQTIANLVVVPIGENGRVSVYAHGGTHLVADVAGYFEPVPSSTSGRQIPLSPARLLDTRPNSLVGYEGTKPADSSTTTMQVTGRGGVPATGVSAVVLSVTATQTEATGYITAWPSHLGRPVASSLNASSANQTIANAVIVPVSPQGQVSLFTARSTHLVADVFGYFTDHHAPQSNSGLFVPTKPTRLLDTRAAQIGYSGAKPGPGSTLTLSLAGRAPLPDSGFASVFMNVITVDSGGSGYVTVWPPDRSRPIASNFNPERQGQVIGSMVASRVSSTGTVSLYSVSGGHLVADVAGYFTD